MDMYLPQVQDQMMIRLSPDLVIPDLFHKINVIMESEDSLMERHHHPNVGEGIIFTLGSSYILVGEMSIIFFNCKLMTGWDIHRKMGDIGIRGITQVLPRLSEVQQIVFPCYSIARKIYFTKL